MCLGGIWPPLWARAHPMTRHPSSAGSTAAALFHRRCSGYIHAGSSAAGGMAPTLRLRPSLSPVTHQQYPADGGICFRSLGDHQALHSRGSEQLLLTHPNTTVHWAVRRATSPLRSLPCRPQWPQLPQLPPSKDQGGAGLDRPLDGCRARGER